VLPILSIATAHFDASIHWNPLNFLPYPFAAILVFHVSKLDRAKIKPTYIIPAGFLILLLFIADWTVYVNKGFFNVNGYAIPAYTRSSLVLIAMIVLLFAIKINPKSNPVIMFMSNNSLALYCIHPFFVEPIKQLSGGNLIISLFLVLILSYLTAIIMKNLYSRNLLNSS
jgi:surface polysaccharide O-acyltransferase-like enzyme